MLAKEHPTWREREKKVKNTSMAFSADMSTHRKNAEYMLRVMLFKTSKV